MENMELTRIKYPDMRMNLIAYIESLSDLEYQRQYWGKADPKNPDFYDDFDESIHFLYDSTDIATDPKSWLGLVLRNDKEVTLVSALTESIEKLFQEHGLDLADEKYMETKEWTLILNNAKALHNELILESGLK